MFEVSNFTRLLDSTASNKLLKLYHYIYIEINYVIQPNLVNWYVDYSNQVGQHIQTPLSFTCSQPFGAI